MIKYSILLIEDSKADQDLIIYYLNKNSYFETDISIASTLNEAVSLIYEGDFDVILSDLNLPDSESENTLTTITKLYNNKPVVILTSNDIKLQETALELGAQDFLNKSRINEYTLVKSIQFAVSRYKNIKNLVNLSFIDSTTRVYNYKFLQDTFENLKFNISNEECLSLFLIDIINFNAINTTYGREFGDALLFQIASRLNNIPTEYYKIIGRGSGTQFYILLVRNKSHVTNNEIYEKFQNSLSTDFNLHNNTVKIEFKIGQSDLINTRSKIYELISKCEFAINQIKNQNEINFNHYTKETNMQLERENTINHLLTQSIDKNELYVVYQPIVDITTNKIDFCESLIRWNCKAFDSEIHTNEFIPIAEGNGFIRNIGIFVLNEFIKNYKFFKQKNIDVSVNLSVKELTDKNFADNIIELFDNSDALPNQLVFDITEYTQFIDSEIVNRNIYKLNKYGFSFSIDDFGTGYSTFHQIGRYRGNVIKIDKSFIDNINTNTYNQAIVSAVANMGSSLGIKVVAEGVENSKQLQILRSYGINYVQGYYFYKPMKFEDFKKIF